MQFSLSRKGRTIVVRSEKTKKILHRFAMNSGNKIANRFCSLVYWNCFLGHLLKFANDRGTTIHCVLFGRISHHQCKRHRKNKEQFHRVTFASPTLVSPNVSDVTLWHRQWSVSEHPTNRMRQLVDSCYGGPNTISHTIDYAMHRSRPHDAVVRVYVAA